MRPGLRVFASADLTQWVVVPLKILREIPAAGSRVEVL